MLHSPGELRARCRSVRARGDAARPHLPALPDTVAHAAAVGHRGDRPARRAARAPRSSPARTPRARTSSTSSGSSATLIDVDPPRRSPRRRPCRRPPRRGCASGSAARRAPDRARRSPRTSRTRTSRVLLRGAGAAWRPRSARCSSSPASGPTRGALPGLVERARAGATTCACSARWRRTTSRRSTRWPTCSSPPTLLRGLRAARARGDGARRAWSPAPTSPSCARSRASEAELLDPHDPASIAAALRRLLSGDGDLERRREAGRERAARYTWAAAATQHAAGVRRGRRR